LLLAGGWAGEEDGGAEAGAGAWAVVLFGGGFVFLVLELAPVVVWPGLLLGLALGGAVATGTGTTSATGSSGFSGIASGKAC